MEQGQKENSNLQETEIVELKSGHRFSKGFFTGVAVTLCVAALFAAAGIFWLQGRFSTGGSYEGVSANLVDSSVRSKINDLTALIKAYYMEDADDEELTEGLYKGLFASLGDPYSAYYTEEEYEEMMISASAQYSGIGAVLQQERDTMQVTIVKTYEGTPAQDAGLKAGDLVMQVGDIDARSMELSELVTHIRGKENSKVRLVISREGEFENREFKVKRATVDVPTVESSMMKDEIGLVVINEFGKATAEDFIHAVEELQKQGMRKIIIDLRDNPGGMYDSVIEVLDYILPEGLIVYTEDKYGNRQEEVSDAEHYLDLPMAVLINGNSASCSEIFAGAIRDYDYGVLIGTKTYGKGVVQTVRPLSDNSAIKLTTAKYFTPKGENIHGTGIEPDIELKYKYAGEIKAGASYDYTKDNQVKRAIRELKNWDDTKK
ncbi:MAG: S41 family peptidase [Eubacterium sp.]|nr:S41 family peptidase [Eubacterium sp.]